MPFFTMKSVCTTKMRTARQSTISLTSIRFTTACLQNGVRPFVELSFMPSKLAAQQTLQSFWYHPIVSPPKDWTKWGDLVSHFAQHLVDRYGIDEVSQWYFEVWNEPNLDFWAGDPKEQTYYQLYDTAAKALKA